MLIFIHGQTPNNSATVRTFPRSSLKVPAGLGERLTPLPPALPDLSDIKPSRWTR